MRITRPRATAFTQLSGVASAAQMATNIVAAIHGLEPTFTSLTFDAVDAINRDVDNSTLRINGSTNLLNGGAIVLKGGDEATHPGDVEPIIGDRRAGYNLASEFKIRYQADGAAADIFIIDKDGNITTSGPQIFKAGMIILWSGAISAIPTGFVICDGNNSTPNLTDRFVIHADADAAGTRNVGDAGGAMTHTLTTAELAAHGHLQKVANAVGGGVSNLPDRINTRTGVVDANVLATSNNAGSGNAHAILNKFHALAYIMKT